MEFNRSRPGLRDVYFRESGGRLYHDKCLHVLPRQHRGSPYRRKPLQAQEYNGCNLGQKRRLSALSCHWLRRSDGGFSGQERQRRRSAPCITVPSILPRSMAASSAGTAMTRMETTTYSWCIAAVAATSDLTTGAPVTTVATSFTAFATGTNYATSVAPFNGICNVCHTTTSHYTSTSGDGHNSGLRCTSCHQHSGSATTNAFAPAGCNVCHGDPPIVNTLGGPNGLVNNPVTTGSTSAGAHVKHATGGAGDYGFACEKCHTGGMPASAIPDYKIEIGFNISATYQSGTYDGRTSLSGGEVYAAGNTGTTITTGGTQACTNIYCHSNGKVGTSVGAVCKPGMDRRRVCDLFILPWISACLCKRRRGHCNGQ